MDHLIKYNYTHEDGNTEQETHPSMELPPEIVSEILQRLENCSESLLAGRLVCTELKLLTDEILEKKQLSLWKWNKSHGEINRGIKPGPIKRPTPTGKIFQQIADIDKYLHLMKDHNTYGNNPFPDRNIYIRRERENPVFPFGNSICDARIPHEDSSLHELQMQSRLHFEYCKHNNQDQFQLLSVPKIVSLLEIFGDHLTSLILECGVTTDFSSVQEFASILENVPNLQCLMLKGINIAKNAGKDEPILFPQLESLRSIKIILCAGVAEQILNNYHTEVKTLQIVSSRDYWYPHFETVQRQNAGIIFGKMRELKIGEFQHAYEFDYLTSFLRSQLVEYGQSFQKLERLSIQYSLLHDFERPSEKLFQVLEFLPNLRELNVGNCSKTEFMIEPDEALAPVKFICSSAVLIKISLPVQFLNHAVLLHKIFQRIRSLQEVRFLDCNNVLWYTGENSGPSLKLSLDESELMVTLQELVNLKEYQNLSKMCIVYSSGEEDKTIFTAYKKMPTYT